MVVSEKVLECGTDTHKLYCLVNNLTGATKTNPMSDHQGSDEELTDQFSEFFMDKITKIRQGLDIHPKYEPPYRQGLNHLEEFNRMGNDEVLAMIKSMTAKTCGSDPLPSSLFKDLAPHMIGIITELVNTPLTEGIFVNNCKTAIIKPLLKKSGLELIAKNYHLVSNLPFMSKLVEKCTLIQLNEHCNNQNLMLSYQSAYRANHSCETSILKLCNNILWAMERQEITALVALDLSVAFDTVDHSVLLNVLHNQFGITGNALNWHDTYLRHHQCYVEITESRSQSRLIDFSVPQSSCAGPLLYSVYASTLWTVIPEGIDLNGFADDHNVKKII